MDVIHPCICGHVAKTYGSMRYHRSRCPEWLNRPNPRGLAAYRNKQTRRQIVKLLMVGPCVLCGQWVDHKNEVCAGRPAEVHRREWLLTHGIHPADFEKILRALAKRYA